MKTFCFRHLYFSGIIISFILTANAYPFSGLSKDDSFSLFSWTRKQNDEFNYGYNISSKIDTVFNNSDLTEINASIFVENLPKWTELFPNSKKNLNITISNSIPQNIIRCSPNYKNCPWLNTLEFVTNNKTHKIQFFFPLPESDNSYKQYDYFTVEVNDSIHLQFQGVNDSIFMGSLLNNERRNEPDKWLIAKGAIMVLVSDNSPLKIKNIELFDSLNLVSEYLGYNLSELNSTCDYYGLDFLESSEYYFVNVSDVRIPDETVLQAESLYTINWELENAESVESCSLFVRPDNNTNWTFITKTLGNISQYNWPIPNSINDSCKFLVRAVGKNGQLVQDSSKTYPITNISAFKLVASTIDNSSALIRWYPQFLDTSDAVSLVIAYSSKSRFSSYPVPNTDTNHYNFTTSFDTIKNLETENFYYFGAFLLLKSGDYISCGPLGFDSVSIIDTIPPVNTFTLNSSTEPQKITLNWESVNPVPEDVYKIGIFMCDFRYPVDYNDNSDTLLGTFPPSDSSLTLNKLVTNKEYFFALMVSDSSGNWSKPDSLSRTIARFTGLSVAELQVAEITPENTQSLFNDSLRIWTTSQFSFTDTIDYWNGPQKGFISISPGFLFRNGNQIDNPLWVQTPFPQKLESDLVSRIRLFRYDIYEDGWMAVYDSIKIDTENNLVSARNTSFDCPFVFMIDTSAPQISLLSGRKQAVSSNQRVIDTIEITDNIKNYNLKFTASPGSESPWEMPLNISIIGNNGNRQKVRLLLPPGVADECSGLRSYFQVSDNINESVLNLSLPVKREKLNCDNTFTETQSWTPLVVSATPDNPEIESIMNLSFGIKNWSYDKNEMRIIKWIPGHSKAFDGGWVEYDSRLDSLFRFTPGSFFWIKTDRRFSIDYGSAQVAQLVDTTVINLKANEWTDFSSPFPFDIRIDNIIQTSNTKNSSISADLIEIYSWENSKNSYQTNPVYLEAMPGLDGKNEPIKGFKPYSIYNPSNKAVSIHIPPVSASIFSAENEKTALSKKKSPISKRWSFRINSWVNDNTALPPVYCGHNGLLSKDIRYSLPPAFSKQRVSVYDNSKKDKWGSIVSSQDSVDGNFYELLFENRSSSPGTIKAAVGKTFGIERSQKLQWFDMDNNRWVDSKDTIGITLKPNQNQVQIIAIGDEQFFRDLGLRIQKSILSLKSVYPNPFGRIFTVQFSLPYQTRKLSFILFNIRGQVIWKKELHNFRPGVSHLRIDEKVSAGAYVLQMKALVEGASSPKVLNKVVMCTK